MTPTRSHVEASRWLDDTCANRSIPSLLIVVGLGDGALLDVIEKRAPATKVLALEPDPHATAEFAKRDWTAWRTSGRLAYLVHPDYAGADEAWRMFPKKADDCVLMVNPRLDANHPNTAAAARAAQKIVYGVKANAEARRQFAPRYLTNVIRNVPAIVSGKDVRALTNKFEGKPAVIAAAGPSLDHVIPELHGITNRALLIAADTALRPLLDAGIVPQLVTALDPGPLNARHFQLLPDCPNTWLVAESSLDRSATKPFDARTFWFHVSKHQPWPWLNSLGISIGQLEVWGSVITGAFQIAHLAGCDPIIFVGADLAYTDGRPYCRGTTYEFDWAWVTSTGQTTEDAYRKHIDANKPKAASDIFGKRTVSTPSLEAFRDWVVARAKRSGRRVINASEAGILFGDGIEQSTLTEALSDSRGMASIESMTLQQPSLIGRPEIATHLRRVRRNVAARASADPLLKEWRDFSGDGFDDVVLSAALDEAIESLAVEVGAPAVRAPIPWASRTNTRGAETLLRQLPEAMIRFRSALNDRPAPPKSVPNERTPEALLVDAVDVLGHVCKLVAREAPVRVSPSIEGVPASNFYAWSDTTRWAVEAFEGLLGKAWLNTARLPEATFLVGPGTPRAVVAEDSADVEATAVRPETVRASLCLVLEWLRCAASVIGNDAVRVAFERVMAVESAIREEDATMSSRQRVLTLVLSVDADGSSATAMIPLVSETLLARALTGVIWEGEDKAVVLMDAKASGLSIVMSLLRESSTSRRMPVSTSSMSRAMTPRVISVEPTRRAAVAYSTQEGVVCVTPHTNQSILVRKDGEVEGHNSWPKPIVGELPIGEHVVAWGSGLSFSPHESAYVMYRSQADGQVSVQQLPVRPTVGLWWKQRLYWACYSPIESDWKGIASWVPGEPIRLELPGMAAISLRDGGDHIRLDPRSQSDERSSQGWRWVPGQQPESLVLGPHGAISSESACGNWRATAHPDADRIVLESGDGRIVHMTCHAPLRITNVGTSLLVSTLTRDLLLFERLFDVLDRGALTRG